jgi:hypothetical protein
MSFLIRTTKPKQRFKFQIKPWRNWSWCFLKEVTNSIENEQYNRFNLIKNL